MHKYAIGGALLLAATHGGALSLGGTQGGAIIGRPLDILIKTSANAADASEGLCLEADVQYGDTRLVPSLVSVAVQKLAEDGSGTLRVRTTQPVNEPIVTLTVRAGCAQKYTRSYTLLADFEPLPVASSREAALTRVPDVAPARVTAAPADDGRAARAASGASPVAVDAAPSPIRLPAPTKRPAGVTHLVAKTRPVVVPVAKAQETPSQPAPAKAASSTREEPAAPAPVPSKAAAVTPPVEPPATPRLKLDPVDVSAPAAPVAAPPAPVQDVSPDAKKLQDMEQELLGLRAQQARLQASLESMNTQLTHAQAQEYNNPVVYGLLAVSAAALAALGWVVLRQRREHARKSAFPWWVDSTQFPSELPAVPAVPPVHEAQPAPAPVAAAGPVAAAVPEDMYAELPTVGLDVRESAAVAVPDAHPSVAPLSFEALADLMQHVEFFDSLGHWADAVAHIDAFLQRFPAASDLPYLLRLRHAVMEDDEATIQSTQQQYLQHFPHPGPTAYDYGVLAPGLPWDAQLLSRISKVWPGAEARRLIEHALTSHPGDEGGLQDRNLESFNDLFFLHSLLDTLDSLPPAGAREEVPPVADAGWTSVAEVVRAPSAPVTPTVDPLAPSPMPDAVPSVDIDFSGFDAAGTPMPSSDSVQGADGAKPDGTKPELPPLDFNMLDFEVPAAKQDNKPKAP